MAGERSIVECGGWTSGRTRRTVNRRLWLIRRKRTARYPPCQTCLLGYKLARAFDVGLKIPADRWKSINWFPDRNSSTLPYIYIINTAANARVCVCVRVFGARNPSAVWRTKTASAWRILLRTGGNILYARNII